MQFVKVCGSTGIGLIFDNLEPMCLLGDFAFAEPSRHDILPEVFKRVPKVEAVEFANLAKSVLRNALRVEAAVATVNVQVLDVLVDEAGECQRSLPESVVASNSVEVHDWPLGATRNTHFAMRDLRRQGRTFLQNHGEWKRASSVRIGNRATHEHAVLNKALDLACSYDQLQMPNIACIEVLASRRMLIEDAHRNVAAGIDPLPKYVGSEHIMGYRDVDNGESVNPAAIKFRSTRPKAESDQLKERRLASGPG